MKLMAITVEMAFRDAFVKTEGAEVDNIASSIVTYVRDGLGPVVAYTTKRTERDVDFPDQPFPEPADSDDAWDEKAREEIDQPIADYWAEHPLYTVSEWQLEVAQGNTRRGYWDWVATSADDSEPAKP